MGRAERRPSSRDRLIDAAVDLVLEHHRSSVELRAAFGYLTPGVVAERAGVSRALIYHHWGDGDDAMSALLRLVAERIWTLTTDPDGLSSRAADRADPAPAGPGTPSAADVAPPPVPSRSDVLIALGWTEMERLTGGLRPLTRAAQTMMLLGLVDGATVLASVERLAPVYAAIAEQFGYEPVPPLTFFDLAFAVSTVVEGFAYGANLREDLLLREHAWTSAIPAVVEQRGWNLLSITVEGMIDRMLRPVDGA